MGKLNPHSHKRLDTRQRIIVGITFFSMFFGAGNLIFPPYLGALAGNRTLVGMVGFVVSAVGLPILGVIVVAQAGGFGNLSARVSKRFALVLGVAIMLTIGPLFAIPRTASTSFEMAVVPFAGQQNLWLVRLLYSLVFFGLAFLVAQHPDKLSQVLGKVMGPLLLVMIVVLFAACLFAKHPGFANPQGSYAHHQLMQGFIDGYQTMDLLAGLYFGIVISANISSMGVEDEHDNRAETGIGGIFTGIMLAIIYAMLGFVGAVSGSYQAIDGATDTGATVLTNLTDRLFGHVGTMFVGLIFIVACFNVCSGLLSTCSSYFHKQFGTVLGYRGWADRFHTHRTGHCKHWAERHHQTLRTGVGGPVPHSHRARTALAPAWRVHAAFPCCLFLDGAVHRHRQRGQWHRQSRRRIRRTAGMARDCVQLASTQLGGSWLGRSSARRVCRGDYREHCRTHAHALNRNGIPHSPAEALSRASSSPTKSP